ncbi:MAG TPA: tetratricopeptide repeat protein [Xanthomonadaceae bacterium]|nr:tetratricopeptide repeat protein [Xanthomonadaceae bacterium]
MDAERWQRLSPLLDAMFELDPETRARSLELLREEDPQTAAELEALMALEGEREDFLAEPLVAPLPGVRPGSVVGPYRLERMLGEGGMGQVWLATRADGLYERRVALKLLRPGLADTNLRLRFNRERQILARLAHPHIARLLDAGFGSDSQPYLALEYIEGEPITDWCRARGLPLDARLRLFLQTCDAVSHAHANLIVHRDLKPSNILVTPLDEVRLLDFGIAKLLDNPDLGPEQTRTGLRAFTLHYAAPEQIRGEPVTTMTDVYALGVVLYELLTGRKPYKLPRDSDAAWEEAILNTDPQRPSGVLLREDSDGTARPEARRQARLLAGDLDNIVLKALAKRPEQRYPSVEALAQDIKRYREGKPVQARRQSLGYRAGKYVQRHRWALAVALLVTAVLTSALGIVAWQARQAVREAARAQALQEFVVGLFEHAGSGGDGALDVRRLLDAGVERGSRELARQPAARAELFGVIARLRLGLGDYPQALALLERQATILGALSDPPASLRLESLADRGRALRLLGRAADCARALRPAQELAQREQAQLPLQAAEFYTQLGRCERATGAGKTARPLFQRALALRRDALHDAPGVVESLADLAGLEADAGHADAALAAYRDALSRLRGGVGWRHPLAVELLRSTCALEQDAGLFDKADADCGRAVALSEDLHGRRHPSTIEARRQLADVHLAEGRFGAAVAALRETRAWLVAHRGPADPSVAGDDARLGRAAWEQGDNPTALSRFDRAIAIRRWHGDTLALADVLTDKARVLYEAGAQHEARELLQEARRLRSTALGAEAGPVGDADRQLGEVEAALGHPAQALARLQRALRLTTAAYGADAPQTRQAALALARFEGRRGDASALARLDALARLPQGDQRLRAIAWLADAEAAALRCYGSDRVQALARLQSLQATVGIAMPEGGALVRQVAALAASCG